MAIYDNVRGGYRIFVGDLGPRVGKSELEKEFQRFGPILDVWIARLADMLLTYDVLVSSFEGRCKTVSINRALAAPATHRPSTARVMLINAVDARKLHQRDCC